MIHYVTTAKGSRSIRAYREGEGVAVADRIRVVHYEDLARMDRLPVGTWLFAELDRLEGPFRDLAVLVAQSLDTARGRASILNDPRHVRHRVDLSLAAYQAGVNTHRLWRATDIRFDAPNGARHAPPNPRAVHAESLRYPVFVRRENDHTGNLSALIDSPGALASGLASVIANGVPHRDLLVAEFCDTRDENGLFRKYSSYNVAGRIIPRTIECSREWMVKWRARILDRERADDELRYCARNPHEGWIRDMFRLARIDYGRIDYAVHNGTPRLWEINTHPWIGGGPRLNNAPEVVAYRNMILPARVAFFEEYRKAWKTIDTPEGEGETVSLDVPNSLRRGIDDVMKGRRRADRLNAFIEVVERQPGGYRATRLVRRGVTPVVAAWLRTARR